MGHNTLVVYNDVKKRFVLLEDGETFPAAGLEISSEPGNGLALLPDGLYASGGGSGPPSSRMKVLDHVSQSLLYVGDAAPGTTTSSPGWRIRRVTIAPNGDVTSVQFASAGDLTCVWDDRASLPYS